MTNDRVTDEELSRLIEWFDCGPHPQYRYARNALRELRARRAGIANASLGTGNFMSIAVANARVTARAARIMELESEILEWRDSFKLANPPAREPQP